MASYRIVTVILRDYIFYGIYCEYDGSILSWRDIRWSLDSEVLKDLPKDLKYNLDCDGTALFEKLSNAELVKKLLEEST